MGQGDVTAPTGQMNSGFGSTSRKVFLICSPATFWVDFGAHTFRFEFYFQKTVFCQKVEFFYMATLLFLGWKNVPRGLRTFRKSSVRPCGRQGGREAKRRVAGGVRHCYGQNYAAQRCGVSFNLYNPPHTIHRLGFNSVVWVSNR